MVIQCREDIFNKICNFIGKEPIIVEDKDGYIDCFDKDWIFINLGDWQDKFLELIEEFLDYKDTNAQFIIAVPESNIFIKRNIDEGEQYIFIRKHEGNYEVRWGASSYIKF